jgi:sugar O-acyltransferase (sialic acid O-acetyltransferase NeuD family)
MAPTDLLFFGAGGHAKVVIEAWQAAGGKIAGIFDDDLTRREILGLQVTGKYHAGVSKELPMIISIGNNQTRKSIAARVSHTFATVQHPSVILSPSSRIREGTVLLAASVISASTVVGKHVIINHRSSVDHDCVVGDFVHIAPGVTVCGEVTIGEGSLIGAGATILPGVRIGKWATVGAGSVIAASIPDFAVAVGVPGKVLRYADPK